MFHIQSHRDNAEKCLALSIVLTALTAVLNNSVIFMHIFWILALTPLHRFHMNY